MATQKVGKIRSSHKRVREVFDYDSDTGIVTWKIQPKHRAGVIKVGDRAGWQSKKSRRWWVWLDGQQYTASRFIWFWMIGESAPLEIDHIDQNPSNDRWTNLRLATTTQNQGNKRYYQKNKNGYRGIAKVVQASGVVKYQAAISHDHKVRYLGLFATAKEAHERYKHEAKRLRGEFYCEELKD